VRELYRIVISVENATLPDTLIYDIRAMVSTMLPEANIVVRESDNVAYYIVEEDHGLEVEESTTA